MNSKSCMPRHNIFPSITPGLTLERFSGTKSLESLTGAAFCSALSITTEWSGAHRELQLQHYLWRSFRGLSIELCELLIIPLTPKLIPNTSSCPIMIYLPSRQSQWTPYHYLHQIPQKPEAPRSFNTMWIFTLIQFCTFFFKFWL